ncbi:MAG: hypothetical protein V4695_09000 [Pseudomonadota bacterium]
MRQQAAQTAPEANTSTHRYEHAVPTTPRATTAPSTQAPPARARHPSALDGMPGRATHGSTSVRPRPYCPPMGASAGATRIAVGMQLRDWAQAAPPGESAARQKAVTRLTASHNGSTDCVDLAGLKLTSLPPGLASIKMTALILDGNSLEALPELPPGLTKLSVLNNRLTHLPTLPAGLTSLDVSGNKLTKVPDFPAHIWYAASHGKFEADLRGNLFCDRDLRAVFNHLKASESESTKHSALQFDAPFQLPTAVLEGWISNADPAEQAARIEAASRLTEAHASNAFSVNLSGLGLTTLPDCLSKLNVTELYLQDNKLVSVPGLPMPELPHGLTTLHAHNNSLTFLPTLPKSLTNLNVENNLLSALSNLPSGLKVVHASHNYLQQIDALPPALQVLKVAHNNLTNLPPLPQTLIGLNVKGNRLTQLPELPDAAWSQDQSTYFVADLRDNAFSDTDLRAFQARLESTFEPDSNAIMRFRIDAPASILLPPCPVAQIQNRADAKDTVKSWSEQGVPHEALVALRADLDTYMLHGEMTAEAFDARYGTDKTDTPMPGKFFDNASKIQDATLRKKFAHLRMALPLS